MRPIVEFCVSNLSNGSEAAKQLLEQHHPDVDVIVYGCLDHCGQCYYGPYALVDGEIVSAADGESLYEQVIARLMQPKEDPYAWLDDED